MELDVHVVKSSQTAELYITAKPRAGDDASTQAHQAFDRIAQLLRTQHAWIFQERVFTQPSTVKALRAIRSNAYGDLADGVEPAWLSTGSPDSSVAVQVHAIVSPAKAKATTIRGPVPGRMLEQNGYRWVAASGLSAPEVGDGPKQTTAAFEKAETLLHQAGADLRSIARTWFLMDHILDWYGQFNQARTQVFLSRGIIGAQGVENRMPASTGIGVSPALGAKCSMDLVAVVGDNGLVRRYHAAGKQRSAYEYGSAFARAAEVKMPAGRTVYISGTAAIDEAGATCHVGDAAGQIQMTLENVVAVLRQMDCGPRDVVQTIAYCATREVKELFESCWADQLPWPWVTLIGDVCRSDLLFEVEAAACPGATKL
ncbi:MAG: Rid family hydrolase [Bacillota bacterium]